MNDENTPQRPEDQLCFALHTAARELVRRSRPCLDPLGLTYTQYTVLLILWEQPDCPTDELGRRLCLDAASLTAVLRSLETKGLLRLSRSQEGGRLAGLTPRGEALRDRAGGIPAALDSLVRLPPEEAAALRGLLQALLGALTE